MKNAISAVFVLSGIASCTGPDNVEKAGTGGTSPSTGGTGMTAGTTGTPRAGASAASGASAGGGGSGVGGTGAAGAGVSGAPGAGTGSAGAPAAGGAQPVGGSAGVPTTGGMSGVGAGAGTGGMSGVAGTGAAGMAGTGGSFVSCPYTPPADPTATDAITGTLTTFNNNGAWTWYSDERAVVDVGGGKIVVGSDANAKGDGGSGRDGNIDVVLYDIATKMVGPVKVLGDLAPDDHNTAGLLVKPDGKYLAFWAGHNENCNSYFSNYDGSAWAAQKTYAWTTGCPTDTGKSVTYNNLWNMTSENKIYNFVRSIGTSPNLLVSSDNGATWTYGGRLSSTPQMGYVAGYYKYWGNGVDRIDFLGTEAHPRDFDNSLYHGYVKGGKTFDSKDKELDADISDNTSPQITVATQVAKTGSTIGAVKINHLWNSDLMRYDDGTIVALWMARVDTNADDPDHRFFYSRFNGTEWKHTYLGKTGKKLYNDEQDYTGLGAVHPNDPHIIYISSPYDLRDDTTLLPKREIFMGVTCDDGATFQWTPVTWNSSTDNIRPIVPKWDESNMVLLWNRGSYDTAQIYNLDVVGIVTQK